MWRREFLHIGMAGVLGSRLAPGFNSTGEIFLKIGNSDTSIFPFRAGEHGWWGYVDAAGQVLISASNSHIAARFSDFYGDLGAVYYDDGPAIPPGDGRLPMRMVCFVLNRKAFRLS
jgi:hypothetical protein